jgi:ketosteroid isomerase-like protein
MPRFLLLLLGPVLLAATPLEDELRARMQAKQDAWNRGDIDSFMEAYIDSPATTFLGATGLTRGSSAILDRYRRNYATREQMGRLTFTIDEIRPLSAETALLLGRFSLDRTPSAGGPASGRFTLVWLLTPNGWRIAHDHTSP